MGAGRRLTADQRKHVRELTQRRGVSPWLVARLYQVPEQRIRRIAGRKPARGAAA